MAFVVHDDARLEPGNLGLIAAGGLAHVFAPRAFVVTGFGRLAGLPQVDAAANTVVVVKEFACGSDPARSESVRKPACYVPAIARGSAPAAT